MNTVHFLNAGRADSTVLFLNDAENTRHVVVIDGAEKNSVGQGVLAAFLAEHGVSHIDLLLLTHLHQDHFGGFWHLIDRFTVGQAVLPYGDRLHFQPAICEAYGNKEFHAEYCAVTDWLKRTGAEIVDYSMVQGKPYSFGEYTLTCLYPGAEDVRVFYGCLNRLCSAPLGKYWENTLLQFKNLCNSVSAVWYLNSPEGEREVLFAGDVSAAGLEKALAGRELHPDCMKMQHHGFQTVHNGVTIPYFSQEQFQKIGAKKMIISTSRETFSRVQESSLPLLPPDTQVQFTFDGSIPFVL